MIDTERAEEIYDRNFTLLRNKKISHDKFVENIIDEIAADYEKQTARNLTDANVKLQEILKGPYSKSKRKDLIKIFFHSSALSLPVATWHKTIKLLSRVALPQERAWYGGTNKAIEKFHSDGFVLMSSSSAHKQCHATFTPSIIAKKNINDLAKNQEAVKMIKDGYWKPLYFRYGISDGFEADFSFEDVQKQIRRDIADGTYTSMTPRYSFRFPRLHYQKLFDYMEKTKSTKGLTTEQQKEYELGRA